MPAGERVRKRVLAFTATTFKPAAHPADMPEIVSVTAKALWYVDNHLNENPSLDQVAEAVGVSRFHLSRAFWTTTGTAADESSV